MSSVSTFLRDERGSQTIQFVLWVLPLSFLLIIVTDASFLYLTHTEMWNVARDTARRMSAGQLLTATEAEAHVATQLSQYDHPFTVTAGYDLTTSMSVVISVPIADAAIFGLFLAPVLGNTMDARVVMRSEPI